MSWCLTDIRNWAQEWLSFSRWTAAVECCCMCYWLMWVTHPGGVVLTLHRGSWSPVGPWRRPCRCSAGRGWGCSRSWPSEPTSLRGKRQSCCCGCCLLAVDRVDRRLRKSTTWASNKGHRVFSTQCRITSSPSVSVNSPHIMSRMAFVRSSLWLVG